MRTAGLTPLEDSAMSMPSNIHSAASPAEAADASAQSAMVGGGNHEAAGPGARGTDPLGPVGPVGSIGPMSSPPESGAGPARLSHRGLRWQRLYTTPGMHPFDTVEWERRDAVIGNERGETVFEQRN